MDPIKRKDRKNSTFHKNSGFTQQLTCLSHSGVTRVTLCHESHFWYLFIWPLEIGAFWTSSSSSPSPPSASGDHQSDLCFCGCSWSCDDIVSWQMSRSNHSRKQMCHCILQTYKSIFSVFITGIWVGLLPLATNKGLLILREGLTMQAPHKSTLLLIGLFLPNSPEKTSFQRSPVYLWKS